MFVGSPVNKPQGNANVADAEAHFQKMLSQGRSQGAASSSLLSSSGASGNTLTNLPSQQLDDDIESDISSASSTLPTPRETN